MSYRRYKSVNFGPAHADLSTVGYTLIGGTRVSGVPVRRAGTGSYGDVIVFPDEYEGDILWDIASGSTVMISDDDTGPVAADQSFDSGTAQGGSPTTIILKADSFDVDVSKGLFLVNLVSGAAKGQQGWIKTYDTVTNIATMDGTWLVDPVDGTDYAIFFLSKDIPDASKTGYSLAPSGLNQIDTTLTGVAATFPQMLVQTWRRFFKKTTKTSTQVKTYADDNTTVMTTQAVSDVSGTQTQGPAS